MVAARTKPEVDQAGYRRRSGDNAGVHNPGVDTGAGTEDGTGLKGCHGVN